MGNERVDDDPIQMQPVLSMKPGDVRQELADGSPRSGRPSGWPDPAGAYGTAGPDGGAPRRHE